MNMKLTALMSGMILASFGAVLQRCRSGENSHRPPRRQRVSAGTYPAGESDGLRSGGGLP